MIASLPMYDWEEVRPATDRLWALIRDRLGAAGVDAPESLSRDGDPWAAWESARLLLGQTCGLPYRSRLHGRVDLVGTPDYALEGAPPGHYYSVLVVRADEAGPWTDFLGCVLAINDVHSQSGWAAPQNHAAHIGRRFDNVLATGAHRHSARAVADGRADIAAIDAVSWRLVTAHDPAIAAKLRVAGSTEPTPGTPMITARGNDSGLVFAAVADAIPALSPADQAALGLRGIVRIPPEAYLAVPTPAGLNS